MICDIEDDKAHAEADDMARESKKETQYLASVQQALDTEHGMSLLQALQLYPKAAAWSVSISSCLIMEGYDKALLGSLYAFPAFKERFGVQASDGSYQ